MARSAIIVEGPDGSGKTTLAKQLCEDYHLEYRRPPAEVLSSITGPGGMELWDWWFHELGRADWSEGVYDRTAFISDPIYCTKRVVDGKTLASGIARLWSAEPILIFSLPPWEVQLANVMQSDRPRLRGDDGVELTDSELEKINYRYWAFYALWSELLYGQVFHYDYTEQNIDGHFTNFLENVGVA